MREEAVRGEGGSVLKLREEFFFFLVEDVGGVRWKVDRWTATAMPSIIKACS